MAATTYNEATMTNIRLCGQLRQFGKSYDLLVRTPAEAVKALCVQIPGFERFISNAKSRGLVFAVFRGKKNIGEGELNYQGHGNIIIAPVICGSKRAGSSRARGFSRGGPGQKVPGFHQQRGGCRHPADNALTLHRVENNTVCWNLHTSLFSTFAQPHQPHPGAQSSAGLAPSHPLQTLSVPR